MTPLVDALVFVGKERQRLNSVCQRSVWQALGKKSLPSCNSTGNLSSCSEEIAELIPENLVLHALRQKGYDIDIAR